MTDGRPLRTMDEFLEALAGLGLQWSTDPLPGMGGRTCKTSGWLRTRDVTTPDDDPACPLIAVARMRHPDETPTSYPWVAACRLGTYTAAAFAIIAAADRSKSHNPALRARLVAACGLPPEVML